MQFATSLRPTTSHICGLSGCTYFSTPTHKIYNFREEYAENKICLLILSQAFLITRRILLEFITNVYWSYVLLTVHLSTILNNDQLDTH